MAIFRDSKKQRQLEREGIVKFPLLDKATVNELNTFFFDLHPDLPDRFYVCVESPDRDYKVSIHEKVKRLIQDSLNEHLKTYRPLVYTLQVKPIGDNSELGVHQDWSVTDESKYRSYSLWIPLIDTNVENGGMFAIKGSHRICTNTRGPSIPPPYQGHEAFLISKMEHIPVKAGEALIFDQATLHYTPPNRSDQPRVSIISTIIEADAQLQLYYLNQESEPKSLETYTANDQYWFDYTNYAEERFQRPTFGKLLATNQYSEEAFDKDNFASKLRVIRGKLFLEKALPFMS